MNNLIKRLPLPNFRRRGFGFELRRSLTGAKRKQPPHPPAQPQPQNIILDGVLDISKEASEAIAANELTDEAEAEGWLPFEVVAFPDSECTTTSATSGSGSSSLRPRLAHSQSPGASASSSSPSPSPEPRAMAAELKQEQEVRMPLVLSGSTSLPALRARSPGHRRNIRGRAPLMASRSLSQNSGTRMIPIPLRIPPMPTSPPPRARPVSSMQSLRRRLADEAPPPPLPRRCWSVPVLRGRERERERERARERALVGTMTPAGGRGAQTLVFLPVPFEEGGACEGEDAAPEKEKEFPVKRDGEGAEGITPSEEMLRELGGFSQAFPLPPRATFTKRFSPQALRRAQPISPSGSSRPISSDVEPLCIVKRISRATTTDSVRVSVLVPASPSVASERAMSELLESLDDIYAAYRGVGEESGSEGDSAGMGSLVSISLSSDPGPNTELDRDADADGKPGDAWRTYALSYPLVEEHPHFDLAVLGLPTSSASPTRVRQASWEAPYSFVMGGALGLGRYRVQGSRSVPELMSMPAAP